MRTEWLWPCAALSLLAASLVFWLALTVVPAQPAPTRTNPPVPATTSPADNRANDPEPIPASVQASALAVTVRVRNETTGAAGSGTLIGRRDSSAYILTADHVTAGAEHLEIAHFADGQEHVYRAATVAARSTIADLALVRLITDDPLVRPASLCPPDRLPAGAAPALAAGCDGGGAPSVLVEKVLRKGKVFKPGAVHPTQCWEIERPPAKGRSGGALFDRAGRVIGVASGAGDDKGYYIHVQEVYDFLALNQLQNLYE